MDGGQLTSSGSSSLTFRPGFARSGKTHSLLGLAKTLPEDDELSLPGTVAGVVEGLEGPDTGPADSDGDGRAAGFD